LLTVALTREGKQVFAKVWAGGEAFRAHLLGLFDEAEGEILLRLLGRLVEDIPAPPRRGARRLCKTSALSADL
jgi:hypothetical protein